MRRTNLRGHALRGEGKAHGPSDPDDGQPRYILYRGHIGRALCECGEVSEVEWTNAARKRWHAAHKDAIRATARTG